MSNTNLIKTKVNFFDGIKEITNWLLSKHHNKDKLNEIVKLYSIDKNIIKRIYTYASNSPSTIIFLDKYLNSLYEWENYSFDDLMYSLVKIYKEKNILSSKHFFYLSYKTNKDEEREKIINCFSDFFSKIHNIYYTRKELKLLYDLFLSNVITKENINSIDILLNGNSTIKFEEVDEPVWKKEKIKLPTTEITVQEIIDNKKKVKFSKEINDFILSIKEDKKNRIQCKNCELNNKEIVILDTNVDSFQEIDVVLIGLNPGAEEAKFNEPFTEKGKHGKYIRDRINNFPENTKWLITNSILCSTANKSEINNCEKVRNNCNDLVGKIIKAFPAKLYVLVGADAAQLFGLTDPITKISGTFYEKINTIPVIHPSGIRSQASKDAAEFGWSEINKKLIELKTPKINNKMLFDVQELADGDILMIYIDENGVKSYEKKKYEIEIGVKKDHFTNLTITTKDIDEKYTVNRNEKFQLIKACRQKLGEY